MFVYSANVTKEIKKQHYISEANSGMLDLEKIVKREYFK